MSIKQLSVFAENKMGSVSQITDVLSANAIDMRAMNIADTQDFGILRMIVSDIEKAKDALKDSGCVVSVTDVVCVEMPDRPGSLGEVIKLLAANDVNIEYMYAFVAVSRNHAYVVFRVNDNEKTEELLKKNGLKLATDEEIRAL